MSRLKLGILLLLLKIFTMKRVLLLFLGILVFTACDDGERIVTNFNFDSENTLNWCRVDAKNVMYIVNSNPDEAIAFSFNDADFEAGYIEDDDTQQNYTIELNNNDQLIYRSFEGSLPNNYFCAGIPSDAKINQEYHSKDGGTITLEIFLVDEEINQSQNTITRSFEIYAKAYNITLKKVNKEEEIVQESMHLGHFNNDVTYDLDDFIDQE